jgi:hypothetical protein
MRGISILSAAAIAVVAAASPSMVQAACAQYDPGCATYPMPKKEGVAKSTSVRADVRADVGAQPVDRSTMRTARIEQGADVGVRQPVDRSTTRTARIEQRTDVGVQQPVYRSTARTARVEQRTTVREPRFATDAGGPVRAAGAVAAGAVTTAGAIATAPFRAADSYAYYNDGSRGWDQRSYAERNGFVCTPGELFKGFDGRLHVCQ